MKQLKKKIYFSIIFFCILILLVNKRVYAQNPNNTQYQITINSAAHQTYGLYYPVTYIFQIPSGSNNLIAQYRYNLADGWLTLDSKTSSDFFNGINAVRFDYPNNIAYLSIAFSRNSDSIFIRILNGQIEVPLTFNGIPIYYDNRHAVVTVTLDDYAGGYEISFDDASQTLINAHVYYSIGIITEFGPPNWSQLQGWINTGYMEQASHSRTHPCTDTDYQTHEYSWQIAGSRDDILTNLSLTNPYVPLYIEPCGFESSQVRQAIVNAHYLSDRGWQIPPINNSYANWGSDGAYQRILYSYDTEGWVQSGGTPSLLQEANNTFISVYNQGGIYHLADHPKYNLWYEGSYLRQHASYISNRTDVWYTSFGQLYLYHYVQERGQVTVIPYVPTAVSLVGFSAKAENHTLVLFMGLAAISVAGTLALVSLLLWKHKPNVTSSPPFDQ